MTLVPVLHADDELGRDLSDDDRRWARERVLVPRHDLRVGRWLPAPPDRYGDRVTALLVLAGGLTVDVPFGDRGVAMLLGPGDVIDPWTQSRAVPWAGATWTATTGTSLAALDATFTRATQRWPAVALRVQQRLSEQLGRAMTHAALLGLPGVEERLLGVLWLLAERWGRVTRHGVLLPLPLTHETLARLVGARRPSVTMALGRLRDGAQLTRRPDRCWLLAEGSRSLVFADGALATADRPQSVALGRAS